MLKATLRGEAGALAEGRPLTDLVGLLLCATYRLEAVIGQGTAGVVYRARDLETDGGVAIKVVGWSTQDRHAARLVREARAASAIDHGNVVRVHELGQTEDGLMFIVMELLEGEDLRARLDRGSVSDDEARWIGAELLEGLVGAHDAGVVHRDVKPENVFLADGDRRSVKLVDFGLSKLRAALDDLTGPGVVMGTPLYMSPEHFSRALDVDERSDIYSTGVLLYELLTGCTPFQPRRFFQCVYLHVTVPPPPLAERRSDLPVEVVAVVHRALEKDPAARFQSAREMAAAWADAWAAKAANAAA